MADDLKVPSGARDATEGMSDDEALARLDASEDRPFVSKEELDSLPERDAVQPPVEGQIHPRSLFDDEPKKKDEQPAPKEEPAKKQEHKDLDPEWASRVDNANTLLGKMQVPRSLWETMEEDRRVEWAEQLKPVYDQNSNVYRELAELKKQVTLQEAQLSQPQPRQASESVNAEPTDYPHDVNLDELTEGFAGEFGEDAAKAFRKPIEVLLQQNKSLTQNIQGMQGLLRDSIVDGARRELRGEFPQLSDPDTFSKVQETAQVLIETGRFAKFDDAMRKAAQIELAEDLAFKRAEERLRVSQDRDSAQMTVPERVEPSTQEPLMGEEAEDYVLAMLDKGYTADQARHALARRNSMTG